MVKEKNEDEIRIRVVPPPLKKSLENIAENLGVKFSTFMKMEFKKIEQSYPEKMRQKVDHNI